MRIINIAQTGNGNSNPAILDYYGLAPVSLQVVTVSGSPNWTVQQTLDDPNNSAITPTWFDHPDSNMVAQPATNKQSNYQFNPAAIRININSGGGSVRLTVLQSGAPGSK